MTIMIDPSDSSQLKAAVRAFILENFYVSDASSLRDEESLLDKGVVDSTGILEVIGFIEERFGFTVEDEEMLPENLDSIDRIASYVARRKG